MFSLTKDLNENTIYFNAELAERFFGHEWQEEYPEMRSSFVECFPLEDHLKKDAFYECAISGEVLSAQEWIEDAKSWPSRGYATEEEIKNLVEVKQDESGEWEKA